MPPFGDFYRGWNGEVLKAMWEVGHNARVAIVDASYPVPFGAEVVTSSSDSTAHLLKDMVANGRVPLETREVVIMKSGEPGPCAAVAAAFSIAEDVDIGLVPITAEGEPEAEEERARMGFYALANDPEQGDNTLFIRTNDEKAFACAMFIVGHSQIPDRQ